MLGQTRRRSTFRSRSTAPPNTASTAFDGMLYGRMIAPPTRDRRDGKIRQRHCRQAGKGYIKAVVVNDHQDHDRLGGCVAKTYGEAIRAAELIKVD